MVQNARELLAGLQSSRGPWKSEQLVRAIEEISKGSLPVEEELALLREAEDVIEQHATECVQSVAVVSAVAGLTQKYAQYTETPGEYERYVTSLRYLTCLVDAEDKPVSFCQALFEYKRNEHFIKNICLRVALEKSSFAQSMVIDICSRCALYFQMTGKGKYLEALLNSCPVALKKALESKEQGPVYVVQHKEEIQRLLNQSNPFVKTFRVDSVSVMTKRKGSAIPSKRKIAESCTLNIDYFSLELFIEAGQMKSTAIPYSDIHQVNCAANTSTMQLLVEPSESLLVALSLDPKESPVSQRGVELQLDLAVPDDQRGSSAKVLEDARATINQRLLDTESRESRQRKSSIATTRETDDLLIKVESSAVTAEEEEPAAAVEATKVKEDAVSSKRSSRRSLNTTAESVSEDSGSEAVIPETKRSGRAGPKNGGVQAETMKQPARKPTKSTKPAVQAVKPPPQPAPVSLPAPVTAGRRGSAGGKKESVLSASAVPPAKMRLDTSRESMTSTTTAGSRASTVPPAYTREEAAAVAFHYPSQSSEASRELKRKVMRAAAVVEEEEESRQVAAPLRPSLTQQKRTQVTKRKEVVAEKVVKEVHVVPVVPALPSPHISPIAPPSPSYEQQQHQVYLDVGGGSMAEEEYTMSVDAHRPSDEEQEQEQEESPSPPPLPPFLGGASPDTQDESESGDEQDHMLKMLIQEFYRMHQDSLTRKRNRLLTRAEKAVVSQCVSYLADWSSTLMQSDDTVYELTRKRDEVVAQADVLSKKLGDALRALVEEEREEDALLHKLKDGVRGCVATVDSSSKAIQEELAGLDEYLHRRKKQCVEMYRKNEVTGKSKGTKNLAVLGKKTGGKH